MTVRRAKIASLLLVVGLIAVLAPVCGCGSQKKTTPRDTSPTSAPRSTAPQSQNTTPPTSAGTSKSEAALEQAKAEGKPVLLNFHSTKCIPCIHIEENINKVKPGYEGMVAFIVVNVYDQSESELAAKYGIQTIPTTFFLKSDGSEANKYVGVLEPDQLKQQLDALL